GRLAQGPRPGPRGVRPLPGDVETVLVVAPHPAPGPDHRGRPAGAPGAARAGALPGGGDPGAGLEAAAAGLAAEGDVMNDEPVVISATLPGWVWCAVADAATLRRWIEDARVHYVIGLATDGQGLPRDSEHVAPRRAAARGGAGGR